MPVSEWEEGKGNQILKWCPFPSKNWKKGARFQKSSLFRARTGKRESTGLSSKEWCPFPSIGTEKKGVRIEKSCPFPSTDRKRESESKSRALFRARTEKKASESKSLLSILGNVSLWNTN